MRILLAALLVAGCYRESTPTPGAPANKQQASDRVTDDVLAFIPKESDIVVGADLSRLRASPLWASQIEPLITNNGGDEIAKIRSTCGFDPLVAVSHVAFGSQKLAAHNEATVVARGIDPQRALDCVAKLVPQREMVSRDGDTLVIAEQGESVQVALSPLGRSAVLGVLAPGANRGLTTSRVQNGAPLRASPTFVDMYSRLDPGASVWFIANGAAPTLQALGGMGVNPRFVDGSVTVTDRYVAVIRVTFKTPDEANNIVTMSKSMAGQVRAMVETFEVRAEGPVARFDIVMTSAQAQTVLGMMGVGF